MEKITTHQVKTELPRLLAAVEKGSEFLISKGKRSVAKLVPVGSFKSKARPKVGEILGKPFEIPDDAFTAATDKQVWSNSTPSRKQSLTC